MNSEKLVAALENYSNVVVGFVVVQSIGFSFTYGTTLAFRCTVHTAELLAQGIILHFALSTILGCLAIYVIKNTIERLSDENVSVLRYFYWAKMAVAALFALIPMTLISAYSIGYEGTMAACMAARSVG